jgi:hypothetical protein
MKPWDVQSIAYPGYLRISEPTCNSLEAQHCVKQLAKYHFILRPRPRVLNRAVPSPNFRPLPLHISHAQLLNTVLPSHISRDVSMEGPLRPSHVHRRVFRLSTRNR